MSTCSYTGCLNKPQVRGLCRRHWEQERPLLPPDRHAHATPAQAVTPQTPTVATTGRQPRSLLVAYLLAIFTGLLGGHCFYLGQHVKGVLYLVTLGFFGIGVVIDLVTLPRQVDARNRRVRA